MGRIRTVKPELFTHEDLFEAEQETGLPLRVAFIGLFTCADREGRFKWRPRTLKLAVLPHDAVDFSRVLDALVTRGFLVRYASETGEEIGLIPTFTKHQVINNRETPSDLPAPPADLDMTGGPTRTPTRDPRVDDASGTRAQGKGKEGKGKEQEGNNSPHTPLSGGNESDAGDLLGDGGAKQKRERKPTIALQTFLADCKAKGEKPIPPADPVFAYIARVGIPREFLQLHWFVFKARYTSPGAKRYKDWRAAFRKSIEGCWFKLWFMRADGTCELTTQGLQAQREYGREAA